MNDKTTPKVSVIMGVYNCANTLNEAIDSLLEQTFQDFELILCDDASEDDTKSVAEKYCYDYPDKIHLISNEHNLGLNKTLNKCLKQAQGEYIARMDGDDISLSDRFQIEVDFLDNNPEYAIVSTSMIQFDETGDWGVQKKIERPQVKDFIHHSPFFNHATCMIRAKAFIEVGGYSKDDRTLRFEDCHLWYKMYAAGYKGYNIQEPLYKMRDDRSAYNRRTMKARMRAPYVKYLGFKMLKMPWYDYYFVVESYIMNFVKGLTPKFIYDMYHRKKFNPNER